MSSNGKYTNEANKVFNFIQTLSEESPKVAKGFTTIHQATGEDKALTAKQKELMALAIGIAIRCEGCIACHVKDSLKAGASRDEIMETIEVSILMGGGPAVAYGQKAYEALNEMTEE
jgi:AhpD family alkylhydroperoxidase